MVDLTNPFVIGQGKVIASTSICSLVNFTTTVCLLTHNLKLLLVPPLNFAVLVPPLI